MLTFKYLNKSIYLVLIILGLFTSSYVTQAETAAQCAERVQREASAAGSGRGSRAADAVEACYDQAMTNYPTVSTQYFSSSSQGACSSHGGVNCDAGAAADGSVICKDEWNDSTVLFDNVIECKVSDSSVTESTYYPYYSEEANSYVSEGSTIVTLLYSIFGYYSCDVMATFMDNLLALSNTYSGLANDYSNDYDSTQDDFYLYYSNDANDAAGIYLDSFSAVFNNYPYNPICFNYSSCQESYGEYAYYDEDLGGCGCESGYSFDANDQCSLTVSESIADSVVTSAASSDLPFQDVVSTDSNYTAISYLYTNGIIKGYSDNTFKPDNTINRAELLKILVEGKDVTPDESTYSNCFPDVTTEWYAKYVCYAKQEGWVSGYPDGTFKPANTVNKVEALKMLLNSQSTVLVEAYQTKFDDVVTSEWFAPYVYTAESLGLLEESSGNFFPNVEMTRAGISENLYRILTQ